ncbi:uncharacterized protein IL334_004148 [Kwoniella shivajii]|uniref:Uncharacterized protein n=1 Tax=Kwoniella shivajii TaxID=564305 RepID=A0ABZ1D3K3_9TREE|nr:hypothetical protein IL334_004148 [Kwoniella shivajii]
MSEKRRYTPLTYKATKNEVGVFTTRGYSEDIKPLWKFKNEEEATRAAEGIWKLFKGYRDKNDFVGMDICRKFIQMGRTRSLRYALRPGGKKYDSQTGKEFKRSGKIYDQGKLDGANVYEDYLGKCWDDLKYKKSWDGWRDGIIPDGSSSSSAQTIQTYEKEEVDEDKEEEEEEERKNRTPKEPKLNTVKKNKGRAIKREFDEMTEEESEIARDENDETDSGGSVRDDQNSNTSLEEKGKRHTAKRTKGSEENGTNKPSRRKTRSSSKTSRTSR